MPTEETKLREEFYTIFNRDGHLANGKLGEVIAQMIEIAADFWLSKLSTTRREVEDEYQEIFDWLDGRGEDFPERKEGEGAYYWRNHLRQKLQSLKDK